jgi:hypothetical protein
MAAEQAATANRLGLLNIDSGCFFIIMIASLMVKYCFGCVADKV